VESRSMEISKLTSEASSWTPMNFSRFITTAPIQLHIIEKNDDINKESTPPKVKCSCCDTYMDPIYLDAHCKQELLKRESIQNMTKEDTGADEKIENSPKDNRTNGRSKREAALNASEKVKVITAKPLKVLNTIKQNRISRSNGTSSKSKRKSTSSYSSGAETECPLCGQKLFGDAHYINLHIDDCLTNSNSSKSNSKKRKEVKTERQPEEDAFESMETYTWGGETRIRVCSLQEGGNSAINGDHLKKGKDEDGDLNVEEVDTSCGVPQYFESDLIHPEVKDDEEVPYHKAEIINESNPKKLIQHLKDKVKSLEENSNRCLICLEHYRVPLVSINCWHVHCEKCWLAALGSLKLCPQCKVITSPNDLRKIYL